MHRALDGSPLLDDAEIGRSYLLESTRGPTPETSPALGVVIQVEWETVQVAEWRFGEPYRALRVWSV